MKKLKLKKINILDVTLFVIAISIILIAVMRVNQRRISLIGEEEKEAEITLVVLNEDNPNIDAFNTSDSVILSDSKQTLGVISSVSDHYQIKYLQNEKDSPLSLSNETNEVDGVTIKFKTNVKTNKHGTYIDSSYFIAPGMKIEFDSNLNKNVAAAVDSVVILG